MSPTRRRRRKMESDTESIQSTINPECDHDVMKYGENPFYTGAYWNNNSTYSLSKNFYPELDNGFYLRHEITFFKTTAKI